MKKPSLLGKVLVPLGILVAILGVVAVSIAVSPFGSMFSVMRDHKSLKVRDDAHEIGALMASVLRDPSLTITELSSNDERMPARLRELGESYLSLNRTSDTVRLNFGGGFYHYGYKVQAAGDLEYRMHCFGENPEDIEELGTFRYSQNE